MIRTVVGTSRGLSGLPLRTTESSRRNPNMLSSLLSVIDNSEFEDNGSLCIESVSTRHQDLLLQLRLRLPEGRTERRSILCERIRSHRIYAAKHADNLSVCDDHVVLWPHSEEQVNLYFNGKPRDKYALLGALLEAHARATHHWFPFTQFMNGALLSPSIELLNCQAGFLACGPQRLINAYRLVLESFGIQHSSPPPKPPHWWDGSQWQIETENLHAFILGDSYVVAPNFTEIHAEAISVLDHP